MLSGDDLSTQYFIAGAAIAILGIAVTQAGWTHKLFIRSLFAFGLGLALTAALWKQIAEAFPKLRDLASPVGSSPSAWFILLVCTLAVIFLLDYRARTTANPPTGGDDKLAIIRVQIDEVSANEAEARRNIVTTMTTLAENANRELRATNERIETLGKSFATRTDSLIRALRAGDAQRDVLLPNDKIAMSLGNPLIDAKPATYPDAASWLSDYHRWNASMRAIDYMMGQWASGVTPLFDLKERHYKNSPMPPENIKTDDTIIPFKTVWHVQSSYANQRDGLFAFLNEKAIFPG